MPSEFVGLPGISNILSQRQQKNMEETVLKNMDGIVDLCRQRILTLFQKEKRLTGNALELELSKFLLQNYSDLSLIERNAIAKMVKDELEGYGPVEELMRGKDNITDIVILAPDKIVYEKNGQLINYAKTFRSEAHLRLFIERLCYLGRGKVDEANPSISITSPEGHRIAIAVPPLVEVPSVSIRKFAYIGDISGMVPTTYSLDAAKFLQLATKGRMNIIFTGPMGTGKTTMIAVLGYEFDPMELPVLVEEVRECPLKHPHLRNYVARPANIEGKGEIKFDYILKQALQSRATRILVAEVRDGAIFYMLRAMATGQSCMGTLHSLTPQEAVQVQIPMLMGQSVEAMGMNQETRNLIIGSAIDLVVQLDKEYDPVHQKESRVCTHIAEVQPSSGETVQTKDIFVRQDGELKPTGHIPMRIINKAARQKIVFPPNIWRKDVG